jgi:hypothetical protein
LRSTETGFASSLLTYGLIVGQNFHTFIPYENSSTSQCK